MHTHTDSKKNSKSRTAAERLPQQQAQGGQAVEILDNRPRAMAQLKLQEAIDGSSAAQRMQAYQKMADTSSLAKNLQGKLKTVQRQIPLVVQRIIDADDAYTIATHIVDKNPRIKSKNLAADSKEIKAALAFFGPVLDYTSTDPELELIKGKVNARKTEVQEEKAAAEAERKATLGSFYAMSDAEARTYLDTLSADEIDALGAKAAVFRTYNTSWGLGSEYMFKSGPRGALAQFVVHVHWGADKSRSGVRLKSHTDKTKSKPGLKALDDAQATALGIPTKYGEAELLAMEQ